MENSTFVKNCQALTPNKSIKKDSITFDELFNLKYPAEVRINPMSMFLWQKFKITAKTKKDLEMSVWNGQHPVDANVKKHICETGTKVRVWMVSRMGDIGVTDNLVDPHGYDIRGLEAEDLYDWEFLRT